MTENRIYSAPDLLTLPLKGVPSYIGAGVLPKKGVLLLVGPKKIGKSFIVLNVAYALANGLPVFGMKHTVKAATGAGEEGEEKVFYPLEVKEPVKVLYLEHEVGVEGVKDRLERLHGFSQGQLIHNLYLGCKMLDLGLHPQERLDALRKELEQVRPQVLVIDPLRRFHRADENDNTGMGLVMENVERLCRDFGIAAIVAHHFGHQQAESQRHGVDRARGASVILDAPDTLVAVEKHYTHGGKNVIKLTWETRQGKPPWEDVDSGAPHNLLKLDFENAVVVPFKP